MNQLQIFKISGVECYEKDGTAYLKLETVARGLGFTRVAASGNEVVRWERVDGYLKELGVPTCGHDDYIPENIFYRLAMKAKNETAEKFQAKVADEIIPSIRKHGGYISGQESMTDDELLAKALLVAQSKIAERDRLIAEKQKQIEILKPKAEYTDDVLNSKGLFSVNQIAGDFGLSAQELNKKLKELGVQYKQSGQWLLYSKYRGKGYLESATCTIGKENKYSKMYSKWTQKGRMFIYELLKKEGIHPISKKEKEYMNQ